jgi:hypothetical protein
MHGHMKFIFFYFLEQLITKVPSDLPDVTSKFYTVSIFEMGHAAGGTVD